jgi:hypothetical protein
MELNWNWIEKNGMQISGEDIENLSMNMELKN